MNNASHFVVVKRTSVKVIKLGERFYMTFVLILKVQLLKLLNALVSFGILKLVK